MTGMEELIQGLEAITEGCVKQLDTICYESLQQFLLNREMLIGKMANTEISESQKQQYQQRVAAILKHDEVILGKMNSFKEAASREIAKMSSAKRQKNAYQSQQQASYYFDKKK